MLMEARMHNSYRMNDIMTIANWKGREAIRGMQLWKTDSTGNHGKKKIYLKKKKLFIYSVLLWMKIFFGGDFELVDNICWAQTKSNIRIQFFDLILHSKSETLAVHKALFLSLVQVEKCCCWKILKPLLKANLHLHTYICTKSLLLFYLLLLYYV